MYDSARNYFLKIIFVMGRVLFFTSPLKCMTTVSFHLFIFDNRGLFDSEKERLFLN